MPKYTPQLLLITIVLAVIMGCAIATALNVRDIKNEVVSLRVYQETHVRQP